MDAQLKPAAFNKPEAPPSKRRPFLLLLVPSGEAANVNPFLSLAVARRNIAFVQLGADLATLPGLANRIVSQTAPGGRIGATLFGKAGVSGTRAGNDFLNHFLSVVAFQMAKPEGRVSRNSWQHLKKLRLPRGR